MCVRVFEPDDTIELPPDADIFATVRTIPGTAGMHSIVASWLLYIPS